MTAGTAATLVMIVVALSSGDAQTSPEATVRIYCKLNIDGAGLTVEGRAKEGELFVHPRPADAPLSPYGIAIVRDCLVRRDSVQGKNVVVDVDYTRFGWLDEKLRFTRTEGTRLNAPARLRDDFTLVKDPSTSSWKILNSDSRQRLGVAAAIRYVSQGRDNARDSTTRANAERTLTTLRQLAAGEPVQSSASAAASAYTALKTFCMLDEAGKQLTPDGWREVAALFMHPGPRNIGMITVIKDFALSDAGIDDDGTAGVMAEYIELLRLDIRTARLDLDALSPGETKMRRDFTLRLSAGRPGQPANWLITGPMPEPYVSVGNAIRYVTELQRTTTDPVIRKNAARTLAGLKRQL
jgi:hypothetical protein